MVGKYDKLLEELPTIAQLLNGTILRNRTVSKAGKTSAVIFVPKFLLGQKVKIVIVPENTEVSGLRKTIDKKNKKISKLFEENRKLKSADAEQTDETIGVAENLEGDDEY